MVVWFSRSLFLWICCTVWTLAAEDPVAPWPLDIRHGSGVITLYQPQPERLEGNILTGRAAASFLAYGAAEDDRVFGALWFTATLDIDREHEVAKVRAMTVTKVVTPVGERVRDGGAQAKRAIQEAVVASQLEIDVDRLTATLEEVSTPVTAAFNATPPRIRIRFEPTVLVVLDGEAQVRDFAGVRRVVNSPAFLIESAGTWWLRGELDWLTADAMQGPWALPTGAIPAPVTEAATAAGFATVIARTGSARVPQVLIATEPTELIVFEGKPSFTPIGDGAVLGADNSDTTVLVEVATGKHFLLLAGRWFRAGRLSDEATWEFVKPTNLPAAFAHLPADALWGEVLAHVPGTAEADAAVAQQQLPQTARIPRTASITVAFDGAPRWVAVSGMAVEYAENAPDAVFRIPGPDFYACRDGVWYTGKDPLAPLLVATSVPEALRHLPPDCPWHNCAYVQVYESTPEYVWCGYTPGYLGWYSWSGCPIYGTGYRYPGWYGPVVYPRPLTWGVGIHYNPWSGWGVSVGVGGPHWSLGISTGGGHQGGWYGCGGINIDNSTNINLGNGNLGNGNRPTTRPAIYERVPGAEQPKLQEASARLRGVNDPVRQESPVKRDNLAVDREGRIARPGPDGNWQTRDQGTWQDRPRPGVAPLERPAAKPGEHPAQTPQRPVSAPERPAAARDRLTGRPAPSFEQTQNMRQRGEQRVQQRNAPQRSAPQRSGGGGGRHR